MCNYGWFHECFKFCLGKWENNQTKYAIQLEKIDKL
jgi:hypothetical protein